MTKQGSASYKAENSYLTKLMKKYQQRECFIPYYKLLNTSLFHLSAFSIYTIFIWNTLFMFFSYTLYDYNNNYIAFDIFCILSVIVLRVFIYLIFKGKVKAYYREEYKYFHWLFQSYVIVFYGAFLRLPYYLYNNFESKSNILMSFANIKIFLFVSSISLVLIFIMFYSERLINVRDFNNAVIYINNQQKEKQSIVAIQDSVILNFLSNLKDNTKAQKKVKKIEQETLKSNKNFLYDGDNVAEKLINSQILNNKSINNVKEEDDVDEDLKRFAPSIRKYIIREKQQNTKKQNVKSNKPKDKVIDLNAHKKRPS